MFLRMVGYKLMFLGKQFLKIDKWFPSSKTCSKCGNVKDYQKEVINVSAVELKLIEITMLQ